ncbi:MAG: hypothetical protein SLAVMIC_00252 [uncultured marine phage]|uniref:Uncharacterized protein n=1 Tax=uncultured marine phage TaxID=707152 RepID=A0A8D9FQX1_9VIRU|nr:MAG: hypothetical protein SLAVMIC_00252 [uncultured marine phage]
MASVTKKNRGMFNQVAECLHDHTEKDTIVWTRNLKHIFANDTNLYFNTELNDQKFEITIKLSDGKIYSTTLILWDQSLPDGFLLDNSWPGSSNISKIGDLIFESVKGTLVDTEGVVLKDVLGKIGKSYIREKRLGKLLGNDPTNEVKESFLKRILSRRKNKK